METCSLTLTKFMEINRNMQAGACEIDGNKEKLIETNRNLLK